MIHFLLKPVLMTYTINIKSFINSHLSFLLELSSSDETRIGCASAALLSLLRSWSGLLHISNPTLSGDSGSPLHSLVQILHIHTHQARKISYETRKLVLDIIFKSLNLQVSLCFLKTNQTVLNTINNQIKFYVCYFHLTVDLIAFTFYLDLDL